MSYKDFVLASRPSQYYTLDEVDGNKDLSGFGNDAPALTNKSSVFVPGFYSAAISADIPNPLSLFCEGSTKEFTVEFWATPGINSSYQTYVKSTAADQSHIGFENDQFTFYIAAGGKSYTARYLVKETNRAQHVVAIMVKNTIALIVNGDIGDPVSLPFGFDFENTSTLLHTVGVMSHLAFYNHALTADEINRHYEAGTNAMDYRQVCLNDGADFYGLTSEYNAKALDLVLDSKDFALGSFSNLQIDKFGNLTNIPQDSFIVYDASGPVDLTVTGSLVLGSGKWAIKPDASRVMSNMGFAFGVDVDISGTCKIFTISTRSRSKAWVWSSDGSGNVTLTVRTTNPDESTVTSTYTYSTPLSVGSPTSVGVVVEQNRIKFGTASSIIQYSGSDWIDEPIYIDSTTEFILGADENYVGDPAAAYSDLFFHPTAPVTTSNMSAVLTIDNGSHYEFGSSLDGYSNGTWTYTFAVPYEGSYYGHSMTQYPELFDGVTVEVDYDGSGFSALTYYALPIPNLAYTGILGSGGTPNGPFTVRATLDNSTDNGHISKIHLVVFSDANFKAFGTTGVATFNGPDNYISPLYENIATSSVLSTILFGTTSAGVNLPSQDTKTVELVTSHFPASGYVLCNGAGGHTIQYNSGTNVVTYSGWTSLYINGQSVSSGGTVPSALSEAKNHIVAISTGGYTDTTTIGAQNTGAGGMDGVGVFSASVYDRVLTPEEVVEHFGAFKGLIVEQMDNNDPISVEEYGAPFAYSYAWQMTGAPQ